MSANRLKLNADKIELMWTGTKYTVASLLHDQHLTLTIGTDTGGCRRGACSGRSLYTEPLTSEARKVG